jgi:hypothetical protein
MNPILLIDERKQHMSTIEPNIKGYGSPIYSVSPDSQTNARISAVLNEAAHVFNWHAEGLWKTEYKDGFAHLLMNDLKKHPKLIKNIIKLNDRIFSMVVYRAVELIKEENSG